MGGLRGCMPGSLAIDHCEELSCLSGLENVTSFAACDDGKSISLHKCPRLSTLSFKNLSGHLPGALILTYLGLQSLAGLERITGLGRSHGDYDEYCGASLYLDGNNHLESLSIHGCSKLVSLRGLGLRGSLHGALEVMKNVSLQSLDGLAVDSVALLDLRSNPKLTSLGTLNWFGNAKLLAADVHVHGSPKLGGLDAIVAKPDAPLCHCGHAAIQWRQRWWCSEDQGCDFEQPAETSSHGAKRPAEGPGVDAKRVAVEEPDDVIPSAWDEDAKAMTFNADWMGVRKIVRIVYDIEAVPKTFKMRIGKNGDIDAPALLNSEKHFIDNVAGDDLEWVKTQCQSYMERVASEQAEKKKARTLPTWQRLPRISAVLGGTS